MTNKPKMTLDCYPEKSIYNMQKWAFKHLQTDDNFLDTALSLC